MRYHQLKPMIDRCPSTDVYGRIWIRKDAIGPIASGIVSVSFPIGPTPSVPQCITYYGQARIIAGLKQTLLLSQYMRRTVPLPSRMGISMAWTWFRLALTSKGMRLDTRRGLRQSKGGIQGGAIESALLMGATTNPLPSAKCSGPHKR